MYTINPRANTKIKQTLVTANKLPKEKNEAIINTYSKITEKKNYFKEKKMKITIEQINSKQHDARFKLNHTNHQLKLFDPHIIVNDSLSNQMQRVRLDYEVITRKLS